MNKTFKYRHYKSTGLAIKVLRKVVMKSDSAFISITHKILIDFSRNRPGLNFFSAVHCKITDSHCCPLDATQHAS